MASQVLSGSSNPSYTNNTGENVRVVINFMAGTPFAAQQFRLDPLRSNINDIRGTVVSPTIPSTITINWAGVSASSSSEFGNITIGRNLAYSVVNRDQIPPPPGPRGGRPLGYPVTSSIENSAIAAVANNAAGQVDEALPTELMLAPGQTFSAVCGVYNIVVIPENG